MSFPRYVQYRNSGVRWLGEIPAHWELKHLRHLASRISSGKTPAGGSETYVDDGVIFLRSQNVYDEGLRLDDVVFISESMDAEMAVSRVQPNDILLNITGASIGRSCVVPVGFPPANVNQHVCAIRMADEDRVPFVGWCFKSGALKAQMEFVQNGAAREGLNFDQIGGMSVALPPSEEQHSISAFLQEEMSAIEALVSEQRKLIELLDEKRQAVVSHAIIEGLDRGVRMKDSGVDWLGRIPAHWRVLRNKVIFQEVDERSSSDEGELLTVSHLTGVTPRSEKNVNMTMAETLEGYKKCQAGDLVINTMWAWMGALGVSPCNGLVSPSYNVYRVRRDEMLEPAFYDYLCRIPQYVVTIKAHSTGVWESRLRLYPDAFLDLRIGLPSRDEQQAIVVFLDGELAKQNALAAEAHAAISLLQERREALISAAVTGKIDVRGLATASPEREAAA
jgi:type I restriction enzyme S subunit